MSIYVGETPEPFASTAHSQPIVLADSAAHGRISSELYRYASGEISGRSFLISGHRGAGKTTLVLKAIEDTNAQALSLTGTRLLLIPLHGPDLLRPSITPATTPAAPQKDGGGKVAESSGAATPPDDTREFLRQVTIGIYRALADLFHQAYRDVAMWKAASGLPRYRDLPEMAAQLRVELDGSPDLATLREFWKRADALSLGILPQSHLSPTSPPPPPPPGTLIQDRGMVELVALSSAAQAYKVTQGTLTAKEGTKQDSINKRSLAVQTVGEVKNLLNPLLGALAGGAVGLGLKGTTSGFVAALAGTATGLGAAITLNYSSSRSRENSRSTEVTFLPDTTIASLDRTLPLLVNRCRQAGIAPVFVVDELDKVSQLAERMGPLVRHLKSLVTEKTFFCFLADRSYLEGLRRSLVATPYRTEYTYFSDRLFVLYRPDDLHKYLGKMLQTRGTGSPNDAIDLQVLPYILLHRSRLHPFDLRRQLARMRNSDGAISLAPGVVRTELAYRFDVLIQVAVEWLLEQPELRERLSQDEDFTQLIYDTLYYPSRMWEQGSAELDVSRPTFFRYIAQRMSPNLGTDTEQSPRPIGPSTSTFLLDPGLKTRSGQASRADANGAAPECALSALDQEFLFARLRELVGFLTDPSRMVAEITSVNAKRFSTYILENIPTDPKFRLLDNRSPDIYVWRRDLFGRSVEPAGVEVVLSDTAPKEAFILRVQEVLGKIGASVNLDRLAAEYNVLSATPAWNSVQQALRRLKRLSEARPEPYPEMEADSNAIWEYAQMLQGSGTVLAGALIAARLLGQFGYDASPGFEDHEQRILSGMQVLSSLLNLKGLSIRETRDKLIRAVGELRQQFSWLAFDESGFDLSPATVNQWSSNLESALNNPEMVKVDRNWANQLIAPLQSKWRERFSQFFRDNITVFEPALPDMICAAAWIGLATVLRLDLNEMTVDNWSELLLMAFTDSLGTASCSPVFGFPALFQLGFEKQVLDAVTNGPFFQSSPVAESKFSQLQEEQFTVQNWLFSWSLRNSAVPKPAVIVVVRGYPSTLARDWKRSPKYAAVIVTADRLSALRQALQGIWAPSLITRIIFEIDPGLPLVSQFQSPLSILSAYPELANLPVNFISANPPLEPTPSGSSLVIAPKGIDDAVTMTTPSPSQVGSATVA